MESVINSRETDINKFDIYQRTLMELANDLQKLKEYTQKLNLDNSSSLIDLLLKRISSRSFTVAIVGEFNRGKSTFINALLGKDILPSGIKPTTATLNRITYGIKPFVKIKFKDGQEKELNIESLKQYVTKSNSQLAEEATNVEEAIVYYPLHYCQNNVDIIDTPGLNDEANMDKITYSVLPEVDVAIMTIMAESPLSISEKKFIETQLLESNNDLNHIIFVVTGIDRCHNKEDAKVAVEHIREEIHNLMTKLISQEYEEESPDYAVKLKKIETLKVYGLSAYQALQGKKQHDISLISQSHFDEFETILEKFLTEEKGAILLESAVNRIIESANEIIKTINERNHALVAEEEKFEQIYQNAQAQIEKWSSKSVEEMSQIDTAAQQVKSKVSPLINSLESSLKQAARNAIASYSIDPEDLDDREDLTERLGNKVSNAVEKSTKTLSQKIENEIEQGLKKEKARLQEFAQSVDQALQHIEMQFLAINASSKPQTNGVGESVAAVLAVYTGFGGIWSGYQEAGMKGAAVGAAGSFGTAIAAGILAGIIGLPITFPVVVAIGIASFFTGKKLTKSIFGEEQVKNFRNNYKQAVLEEIEKQVANSGFDEEVNRKISQTFESLKQKVHRQIESVLTQRLQQIHDLRVKRERDKVQSEYQHHELEDMQETTQKICHHAQKVAASLKPNENVVDFAMA